jgi:hypothetical protein
LDSGESGTFTKFRRKVKKTKKMWHQEFSQQHEENSMIFPKVYYIRRNLWHYFAIGSE